MTEAALCTDGSSNLVWRTEMRRTEQGAKRRSGRQSRGCKGVQDDDEAAIARKMAEVVLCRGW